MKMGLRDLIDVLEEGSGKRSGAKDLLALLKFAKGDQNKKKEDEKKKEDKLSVDELTAVLFFAVMFVPVYILATYGLWALAFGMLNK